MSHKAAASVPLRSTTMNGGDVESKIMDPIDDKKKTHVSSSSASNSAKSLVAFLMVSIVGLLGWDLFVKPPEDRWIRPDSSELFLKWVEGNPYWGQVAILLVIAVAVVFMIPVGTPLTLGCGYIYKGVYGWVMGVIVATIVAMGGSALGAVSCFLLGRYMMRDRVRKWIRKYPLFDAIDIAVSEHGIRIMAMLYLTPILPLGPVSYMCGTTSMPLSSFVMAKIASLPLMLFYVFIGASTGTLLSDPDHDGGEVKKIENNKALIVMGVLLSGVMVGCISHHIRKELDRTLERHKKDVPIDDGSHSNRKNNNNDEGVELGMGVARQRRTTVGELNEKSDAP